MADLKITQLTELAATPDDADILAVVDDVAGTPVTKKVTVANLLAGAGGGGGGGVYGINVETLSAAKTLTANTDKIYQYLDEGGANRIITLATANAVAGDRFVVRHNGVYNDTYYLQINQAAIILDNIWAGGIRQFIFDGTNWTAGEIGTGENDNKKGNVMIGRNSNGYGGGTAVGYNAVAYTSGVSVGQSALAFAKGVAIGRSADGSNYGVAIGNSANGDNYGTALGYETDTNAKKYSIALGVYSETERVGELSRNINGTDTDQENNIIIQGWEVSTANATPVEMLAGGQAGQRFTIRASSSVTFTMLITARDNVAGHCAAYKVEGAIKRDAANNTVMLAAATITVIHEDDATWDVAVTADDTNEALIITVTGDDTNPTQWAARMDAVETHF